MSAAAPRFLVAGVGNIFLGDNAFGVEVIRYLSRHPLAPDIRLVDFGIRGMDLAYALLEGYDLTILVDATVRGGVPGTLYTLEPEIPEGLPWGVEAQGMSPANVLALAARLGGPVGRLVLVGCEPSPCNPGADPFDIPSCLSAPVARAIVPAAERVRALIEGARSGYRSMLPKG